MNSTMYACFEMTPEIEKFLFPSGKEAEYVVLDPVNIEVVLNSGEVHRPQEIRERVVRCRDCKHAVEHCDTELLDCLHFAQWDYYNDEPGHWMVKPDGFCAWGEERET